jgi:AcrR family transcriptional regulator
MFGKKSAEKSVTEVRLVEAAAQLFSRHGFKATTTREIAQLADLNEVTLFRNFPRKLDLFLAALESQLSRFNLGRELQASLSEGDDPEVVLPQVVTFVLNVLVMQPELQHLLYVAGFEVPESDKMIREHLGAVFDLLCVYFKKSVEKQTIRDVDPVLATLGLLGIVAAHQSLRERFIHERPAQSEPEQAIAAYVGMYLHGLKTSPDFAR